MMQQPSNVQQPQYPGMGPAPVASGVVPSGHGAVSASAAAHQEEEEAATGQIEIIAADTNTAFFVTTGGNADVKKILKSLGGVYNTRVKGYKFASRDMDKVMESLKQFGVSADKSIHLVDPRTVITVTFTQSFQWPGDMKIAEERLAAIGLSKQGGRGNNWTGDLAKSQTFLSAFGISVAPATQSRSAQNGAK